MKVWFLCFSILLGRYSKSRGYLSSADDGLIVCLPRWIFCRSRWWVCPRGGQRRRLRFPVGLLGRGRPRPHRPRLADGPQPVLDTRQSRFFSVWDLIDWNGWYIQGVQEKLCFFTIHCNPCHAYIAVRDRQSSQRNASVQSLLLAGNFLYNQ